MYLSGIDDALDSQEVRRDGCVLAAAGTGLYRGNTDSCSAVVIL